MPRRKRPTFTPYALFLFSRTGYAEDPWIDAGIKTVSIDTLPQLDRSRSVEVVADVANAHTWGRLLAEHGAPSIIVAFPPCTDLAASGAKHWQRKAAANPHFQRDAVRVCKIAHTFAKAFGVPYLIENPVGKLSTAWRAPDAYVNPSDFGGYIPEADATHPQFPRHIAPRDAYPKKTGLWIGHGFVMPEKRPVAREDGWSRQQCMLGGKKARTKLIRSLTPRGLARAIFEANRHHVKA